MNWGWRGEEEEVDDCRLTGGRGEAGGRCYEGAGAREGDVCAGELKSTFAPLPFPFGVLHMKKK